MCIRDRRFTAFINSLANTSELSVNQIDFTEFADTFCLDDFTASFKIIANLEKSYLIPSKTTKSNVKTKLHEANTIKYIDTLC